MPRPGDHRRRPSPPLPRLTADLSRRPLRFRVYPDSVLRETCEPLRVVDEDEGQDVRHMLDAHDIEPIAVIPDQAALRRAWLRSRPLPMADLAGELDRAADHIEAGGDAATRVAATGGH
jgi:hypothetical protein